MADSIKHTIHRKGRFDAGHRLLDEKFRCFNIHGHTFHYELVFEFQKVHALGYAMDFKEIKRIAGAWIQDHWDHGFIANPADQVMIDTCRQLGTKCYALHLVDDHNYCNPTVENTTKELFFVASTLVDHKGITLTRVVLNESSDSSVTCQGLTTEEWQHFKNNNDFYQSLLNYRESKGQIQYDSRETS